MSLQTSIPYLTASWNPIKMTCTPCSLGCDHCWALKLQKGRLKHLYESTNVPVIDLNKLDEPRHWKKPRRIGVQFMGDLFHPSVTQGMLTKVFDTICDCPQHEFLILTKRIPSMAVVLLQRGDLPQNVWLGATICDQQEAESKRNTFQQIVTTLKPSIAWLSIEPMLGPINIVPYTQFVNWVVVGCESGAGHRPMKKEWVIAVKEQCLQYDIMFYYKQQYMNGKIVTNPLLEGLRYSRIPKC